MTTSTGTVAPTTWGVRAVAGSPCPQCTGARLYGLTYRHGNTCPLLAAEDATQAADYQRGDNSRPSTTAELTLLNSLGFAPAADEDGVTRTHVGYITRSVRHRQWAGVPDLDTP